MAGTERPYLRPAPRVMIQSPTTSTDRQDTARIVDDTCDHLIGTWQSVVFVVWRRETSVAGVGRLVGTLHELARGIANNVVLFVTAEEDALAPAPRARGPLAQMLRTAPLASCAVTLEGEGFRAAALRAVATGIGLAARPRFPYRPFSTVQAAAVWLEKERPAGVPALHASALVRAIARARGSR